MRTVYCKNPPVMLDVFSVLMIVFDEPITVLM
jgi:hypothetical protein